MDPNQVEQLDPAQGSILHGGSMPMGLTSWGVPPPGDSSMLDSWFSPAVSSRGDSLGLITHSDFALPLPGFPHGGILPPSTSLTLGGTSHSYLLPLAPHLHPHLGRRPCWPLFHYCWAASWRSPPPSLHHPTDGQCHLPPHRERGGGALIVPSPPIQLPLHSLTHPSAFPPSLTLICLWTT